MVAARTKDICLGFKTVGSQSTHGVVQELEYQVWLRSVRHGLPLPTNNRIHGVDIGAIPAGFTLPAFSLAVKQWLLACCVRKLSLGLEGSVLWSPCLMSDRQHYMTLIDLTETKWCFTASQHPRSGGSFLELLNNARWEISFPLGFVSIAEPLGEFWKFSLGIRM